MSKRVDQFVLLVLDVRKREAKMAALANAQRKAFNQLAKLAQTLGHRIATERLDAASSTKRCSQGD